MNATPWTTYAPRPTDKRRPAGRHGRYRCGRRGMSLLIVILLLAMTLGLSYAAVRSQHTAVMIHHNFDRREAARQAAVTGMTLAIKKMHTAKWAGVDTTLTGTVGDYESYAVTYTTGDPAFYDRETTLDDWENPDYDDPYFDEPYRVTLEATGYAQDRDNPSAIATYKIRAVMRLIPRAIPDEPNGFDDLTNYTLCQWTLSFVGILNGPFQVKGPTRLRSPLELSREINWNSERWEYSEDLTELQAGGGPDWRPFTDNVYLPSLLQYFDSIYKLQSKLGVSFINKSYWGEYSWQSLNSLTTYQLYPGGKKYQITELPQALVNTQYLPDPQTNPLGIFHRENELHIHENVTICGMLVTEGSSSGDLEFFADNIKLHPLVLPTLDGSSDTVRLPTAVVGDDIQVHNGAKASLVGTIIGYDEFEVDAAAQDAIEFAVAGHVAARALKLHARSDWVKSNSWWSDCWDDFDDQRHLPGGITNFATWLAHARGLDPAPKIVLQPDPDTANIRYHWHNPNNTVFVVHEDDDGLRWNLLEWKENP